MERAKEPVEYQQLKESRGGAAGGGAPTLQWAEIQDRSWQVSSPFPAVVGVGAPAVCPFVHKSHEVSSLH